MAQNERKSQPKGRKQPETKKQASIQEILDQEWQFFLEAERKKKYPNIMLLGISGAGKSTLVNSVFGITEARISNVAPETKGFCNFYDGHNYGEKINLIDTAGYELNQADSYLESVIDAVQGDFAGLPVHVLWYCLPVANERIEAIDIRLLKELKAIDVVRGRLCIVFTKCEEDDEKLTKENAIKRVLHINGLSDIACFEVSSDAKLPLQLPELIAWSSEQLEDEDLRASFIGSQMARLDLKEKAAKGIINNACLTVAAVKVSELIIKEDRKKELASHQMKMVAKIFSAYGIDSLVSLSKGFEKATSLADFGNGIVSLVVQALPKAGKFQEHLKTAMATGLTKLVGEVASRISYSYIEKHIKGIPVKFEEIYSDPEASFTLAKLLDEAVSTAGKKMDPSSKLKESSKTEKKSDKHPSNK